MRKPVPTVPTDSEVEGRRSSGAESSARESQLSSSDSQELPATAKLEVSPTLSSLLVSSPDDVDTLNEGFLTPSEDVAPAETALASAFTSVQPPEMLHKTPVAKSVPLPDDANKSSAEPEALQPESKPAEPVTPSRQGSISGHPHLPARSVSPPVSPPSRTGSPSAPPLPRRAAARRAVPPPPPAVPPAPSADMSLAKAAEQPNGHHAEPETHAELDTKAKNTSNPVVAPRSDPPPPSEQPGSSSKEKEEAAGTTARSTVAATLGAEAEIKPSGDQSDETPQQQSALSGEGSAVEKVAVEGADAVANDVDVEREVLRPKRADAAAEEKTGSTRARRVPPPPLRHPHPVRSSMEAEAERQAPSDTRTSLDNGGADRPHSHRGKDKFEEDSQPIFAPDGTPYVGDGTWEERTWKELTRLREDMFWARMGRAH